MDFLYAIIIGYLCGSVPTAYWIGRFVYRINIFEHGSKNMGATNAYRVLGRKAFAFTLAIDVLKGMMAVIITAEVLQRNPLALFVAGASALAGHSLSFWVKFKGGKGVASGLGVFMALAHKATLSALLVFLFVLLLGRMVSLGSIVAAISLPFLIYFFKEGGNQYYPYLTGFSALVAIFVVYKHKANIKRIFKGEELAIGQQPQAENSDQDMYAKAEVKAE